VRDNSRRRRPLRLPANDYSQPGAYFVTIVTASRKLLFGTIVEDEMRVSLAGTLVTSAWQKITSRLPGIELDEFVVMPNHIHGVIWLTDPERERRVEHDGGAASSAPTAIIEARGGVGAPLAAPVPSSSPPSLGDVLRAFKSTSALSVNRALGRKGSLWQRGYYERVIRDEEELYAIRRYIIENPLRWALDKENPDRV
jgi:REP element-mobilizing transposase RayT